LGLAQVNAGDTYGLGKWWTRNPIVTEYQILR
jgi:hypothetical protein